MLFPVLRCHDSQYNRLQATFDKTGEKFMLFLRKSFHVLHLIFFIGSFSSKASAGTKPMPKEITFESLWYKGSVESAFEQSKKLNKPIFLYWGAVWCPPCNELKTEVFSKPKFRDLIKSVIPVHLNGDTETAQKWGDRLKVSGYPTLLILDSNKQELLRISESLNIDEFEQAFLAATALGKPIKEIINDALTKDVSPQVWQALAYTHWEEMGEDLYDDAQLLEVSINLLEKVPSKLSEIRSVMIGKILRLSAHVSETKGQTPETQALLKQVGQLLPKLIAQVFESEKTIIAARSAILYDAGPILSWSKRQVSPAKLEALYAQWAQAGKVIQTSEEASIDSKLWASYIPLEIFRLNKGTAVDLPQSLVMSIKNAVKQADQEAKTTYERKAVITGAAYLLRKIGAFAEAKILLEKELKTTKTPWYIQSSLSRLAEAQNKPEQALYWSAKARESARGKATKIQWTVNDLLLTIDLQPTNIVKIEKLLKDYYELAFSLNDGFLGRNKLRASKVLRAIKSLPASEKLKGALVNNSKSCKTLNDKNALNCQEHFSSLLGAKQTI